MCTAAFEGPLCCFCFMRFPYGVLNGAETRAVFDYAQQRGFALPAVNVVGSNSINAVLETAARLQSPIIIQFSSGGAHFWAGKGLDNKDLSAAVHGAVDGAHRIRFMAEKYRVSVILHTDHANRKLLPWVEGMIAANEQYYAQCKRPLFSSHMLDLSEEPLEENVATCVSYFKRLSALDILMEVEVGVTGGEEDGVDHTQISTHRLYTQPEEVAYVYEEMRKVASSFTIAAAFGNVHGVYKPGNVSLKPIILKQSQEYVQKKHRTAKNPVHFVFHGGSGSKAEEIQEAISYGVVKMNVDTDVQWAFWAGVHAYYQDKKDYLQHQVGNPQGADAPNKKYYDPRAWLRVGEQSVIEHLTSVCEVLGNVGTNV